MKDNKGFSLVELLIAMAIASIVAGSIGYFLVTSLRMYGKETVNVALQQELQTSLNQIMDYAMESQTIAVKNTGNSTDYLVLGTIYDMPDSEEGSSDDDLKDDLEGQIFWSDSSSKRLYMKKVAIQDYKDATPESVTAKINSEITDANTKIKQYILAEKVEKFYAEPVADSYDTTTKTYSNPLGLNITLEFKQAVNGNDMIKNVTDNAVLRNKVKDKIYINGTDYSLKTDTVSATLKRETTTVENEVKLGRINTTQTVSGVNEGDYIILEIIPNPHCAAFGYTVGGCEPIGPEGIDAVFNQVTGRGESNLHPAYGPGSAKQNPFIFSTGDISNVLNNKGRFSGYFEKVNVSDDYRDGAGGVYALEYNGSGYSDNYNIKGRFVRVADGKGKYCVKYNESDTDEQKKEKLAKAEQAVSSGDILNIIGWNSTEQIFEQKSDTSESNYNFSLYTEGDDCGIYFISEYASSSVKKNTINGGKSEDFEWVWHEVDDEVTEGIQLEPDGEILTSFSKKDVGKIKVGGRIYVNNYRKYKAVNNEMFILYSLGMDASGGEYGLFEGERWGGSSDNGIAVMSNGNFVYCSSNKAVVEDYKSKHKITLVSCTPAQLAAENSEYDQYIDKADLIIISSNLATLYRETANVYNVEHHEYDFKIEGEEEKPFDPPEFYFSNDNDLTFDQVKRLYNRVITNDVSIACSHTLDKATPDDRKPLNIVRLYYMLYKFQNKNIVYDSDSQAFYGTVDNVYQNLDLTEGETYIQKAQAEVEANNASGKSNTNNKVSYKFSGRVMFTDFMQSFVDVGRAYSVTKNEDGTLKYNAGFKFKADDNNEYTTPELINIVESSSLFTENHKVTNPVNDFGGVNGQLVVNPYVTFSYNHLRTSGNNIFDLYNKIEDSNHWALALYDKYYKDLGFELVNSETPGVYSNQMLFLDSANTIISYYRDNNSQGMNWISNIIKNGGTSQEKIPVGDIDIVGGGFEFSSRHDRFGTTINIGSQTNIGASYDDSGVWYDNPATVAPDGVKTIYLSRQEYLRARKGNLASGSGENVFCIYAVARTSVPVKFKELNSDYSTGDHGENFLQTKTNEGGNLYYSACAADTSHSAVDQGPRYVYQPGTGSTEQVVVEFVYKIDPLYFQYAFADTNHNNPDNSGNNEFIVHFMGRSEGDSDDYIRFQGTDTLRIVVRDDFDLD